MSTISKILHDVTARHDAKIRTLLRRGGPAAYGRFWIVLENLAADNGTIDGKNSNYLELLSFDLAFDSLDETRQFLDLLLQIGLLRQDENGSLYSARLRADIEQYKQKRDSFRQGGLLGAAKRWGHPVNVPQQDGDDGSKLVAALRDIFSAPNKVKKQDFFTRLQEAGSSKEQINELWHLGREYTRPCLLHYVELCSSSLKGRGIVTADFVAYLTNRLLHEKANNTGWFHTHSVSKQNQPTPTRKRSNKIVSVPEPIALAVNDIMSTCEPEET